MSYANDPRYELVATGTPCPMKGRDDCLVATKWKGRPAWWEDGNIYALKPDLPQVNTWVQNLDRIRRKR